MAQTKKVRVAISLPEELARRARVYVASKGTTISFVVEQQLLDLLESTNLKPQHKSFSLGKDKGR